jgi:hypothetical protein
MSTDDALRAERLILPICQAKNAKFYAQNRPQNQVEIDQKCGELLHARFSALLGGDLKWKGTNQA